VVRALVNVKDKLDNFSMNGTSPLSIAASHIRLEMMGKLLIMLLKTDSNSQFLGDVKANLDKAEDSDGSTPLCIATKNRLIKIVQVRVK